MTEQERINALARTGHTAILILRDILRDEQCWHDRHGHCRTHDWRHRDIPCPYERGRELLRQYDSTDNPAAATCLCPTHSPGGQRPTARYGRNEAGYLTTDRLTDGRRQCHSCHQYRWPCEWNTHDACTFCAQRESEPSSPA